MSNPRRHSSTPAFRRYNSGHIDDALMGQLRRRSLELTVAPPKQPSEETLVTQPHLVSEVVQETLPESQVISRDSVEKPGEEAPGADAPKRVEAREDDFESFGEEPRDAPALKQVEEAADEDEGLSPASKLQERRAMADAARAAYPALAHAEFLLQRLEELSAAVERLRTEEVPDTIRSILSKMADLSALVELARTRLSELEGLTDTLDSHSDSMSQMLTTWAEQFPQMQSCLVEALQSAEPGSRSAVTWMPAVEHCLVTLGILSTSMHSNSSKYLQQEDDCSEDAGLQMPSQKSVKKVENRLQTIRSGKEITQWYDDSVDGFEADAADISDDDRDAAPATQISHGEDQIENGFEQVMVHEQEEIAAHKTEEEESSKLDSNELQWRPAAPEVPLETETPLPDHSNNSADLGSAWPISPQSSPAARSVMASLQRYSDAAREQYISAHPSAGGAQSQPQEFTGLSADLAPSIYHEKVDAVGHHIDGLTSSPTSKSQNSPKSGTLSMRNAPAHSAPDSSAIAKPIGQRPKYSRSYITNQSRRHAAMNSTDELSPLQMKLRAAILGNSSTLELMTILDSSVEGPPLQKPEDTQKRRTSLPKVRGGSQHELVSTFREDYAPPWSLPGLVGRQVRWESSRYHSR